MDRTDYQILNLLQTDSRTTLKHIGDQVGLTAPAVSERIRRMEEKGVIKGFSIRVDRNLLDSNMTGFILVAPAPELDQSVEKDAKRIIRPGEQVIVSARGLFDGKVLT